MGSTTSIAYTWLQKDKGPADDRLRRRWSDALQVTITPKQWRNACILSHKCSISTKMQETAYKLLTKWYITPVKRCMEDTGSLFHIWWQCPKIAIYWNKVIDLTILITETSLPLDATCCLLHITKCPLKKYKNSLTKHLLNAAKSLIPIHWKSPRVPTVVEWLHRVTEMYEMEDTLAQSSEQVEKFHVDWQPWNVFKYSRAFVDITNNK